ncbi:MAG TPA: histidine-type phosphatase [Bryobacteraceae bacterium]|nr:histidine-type phosphatase [Bryobacteraceae bacterium]
MRHIHEKKHSSVALDLRIMNTHSLRLVTLAVFCGSFLGAQSVDDTELKQVIIFGRHNVRAPVADNATLNRFSVKPFPSFGVDPGILTDNGAKLETILGGYYRLWLTKEGLLTGNDSADANFVYFRANILERTVESARRFAIGLLPAGGVNVNSYPSNESDPLFDPIGAGVAGLDPRKALAAVNGRLGDNGQSLTAAYASDLALVRSVLLGYPAGQVPPLTAPAGVTDVAAIPIDITAGTPGLPVNVGGLMPIALAVDPFVMEYADGLPLSDVGWGQLSIDGVSQTTRLYNLVIDIEGRTPYLAGVQSSNVASHVVRSMVQAATGNALAGALGNPSTKVIVLVASDNNIGGLAGLLHLDWLLPGYQPDYCAPGGALVFELRQSQSTGEYIVRASYIAQTLDQLRNRTVLTLVAPPASAPVFVPGCSTGNATFDCSLEKFVEVAKRAIEPRFAQTK